MPVTIQIQNRKDPWCLVNSKLRSAKHPELKIAQLGVCWEAPSFQESLEPHVTEDTSSGVSLLVCFVSHGFASALHPKFLFRFEAKQVN